MKNLLSFSAGLVIGTMTAIPILLHVSYGFLILLAFVLGHKL